MAWRTVDDMADKLPLDVFDANGELINRPITGFDETTGWVESFILWNGKYLNWGGKPARRREKFAAPLTWKTIPEALAKQRKLSYAEG